MCLRLLRYEITQHWPDKGAGTERTAIKMDFETIYHYFSVLRGEMASFICFCDSYSSAKET